MFLLKFWPEVMFLVPHAPHIYTHTSVRSLTYAVNMFSIKSAISLVLKDYRIINHFAYAHTKVITVHMKIQDQ